MYQPITSFLTAMARLYMLLTGRQSDGDGTITMNCSCWILPPVCRKHLPGNQNIFPLILVKTAGTIAAVDVQPGKQSVLHLLDVTTGTLIKALPNADNLFYTYPKFINDKQLLVAVRRPRQDKWHWQSLAQMMALCNT